MTTVVLTLHGSTVPAPLRQLPGITLPGPTARSEIDSATEHARRVIVVGDDALLAAVVTRLMRKDRLHVDVALVPTGASRAARNYRLPTGRMATRLALEGSAQPFPLVRDDTGTALVGSAVMRAPAGEELFGEAYVDDDRLFRGPARGIEIRPSRRLPGVRATTLGRLPRRRWLEGRAIQTGAREIALTRDGVDHPRVITRSTFYRHTENWRLVCVRD
ncbi:hypothetical protein HT102_13125 [Hoyosella sp. G463]|uniref:DAGKc domain-containing protein n=2 Tax=Lolliginicoccus lacisalsi TaxID=2742202 RepID=A0A927PLR3_9ACTN|nr:hypothetical protein [Lolliginicoccus lacisalsi]